MVLGRWRWPDGRTSQGKFVTDCPTEGLLLSDNDVFKVTYSGKTDIADPELRPASEARDDSAEGKAFKEAATAWESRLRAQNNIAEVRMNTTAAREAMTKLKADDGAAQGEKQRADKDAEETKKLSSIAEKEAADAAKTAEDLEKQAAAAREKADQLAKLASERASVSQKSATDAEAAQKKAKHTSDAMSAHVKKLVALEKELAEMEKILATADSSSANICDVSLD